MTPGKKSKIALLILAGAFVAMQFVRPTRTNPPADPAVSFESVLKPSPQVSAIVQRACRDCHSHQTVWPWYSNIAPASWLVADDVSEAREHLNFSEWGRMSAEKRMEALREICKEVTSGDMPLWQYKLLHTSAQLTRPDVDALCALSAPPR